MPAANEIKSPDRDVAVFVPGWGSTTGLDWKTSPIKRALERQGYQPAIFIPEKWKGDIHASGQALTNFLERLGAPRVVGVGHSLGGLIWRVADTLGADVDAVMTLGTPHKGSPAAWLLTVTESGRQMKANSEFLLTLDAQEHWARYLTISGIGDVITHDGSWDKADEQARVLSGHVDMVWSLQAARHATRFFGPARHHSKEPMEDGAGIVAGEGGVKALLQEDRTPRGPSSEGLVLP